MGFLATLVGGPIMGVIGSLISGGMAYLERKQRAEERQAEMAHERDLQKMNIDARGRELESEEVIVHTQATAAALTASYGHDASYGPIAGWASTTLRFVRPLLTLLLLGLVASVYFTMPEAEITAEDGTVTEIGELVILKILFLAEAAVTWWFLDRRRTNK